ncbi:uncharacterized protein LOC128555096 [Mercenaria mercenaria]|uniref:uncharacterized protein LOC128555096 n=1 Tax=Mercenaria mercenaria TaxID=6596 RepID=UPI00234F8252|nr:uncharacterized protein LOC128555096 [Mercenaria mercenaria]
MAEGGHSSLSVLGASEEIYDYNCSSCEESGVHKEAHKYCDSCNLYYCKKCLGEHNKFPALRGHLIKDVTSQPKQIVQTGTHGVSVTAPQVEPCENHPEEMIKMFCGEHDAVCCTVCIALDHRGCKDVHYILDLAKDIRKEQEYIDYMNEVTRIKTVYEDAKESIQDEIKKMSVVRTEIIREIKEYKKELISRIEELESKSIEDVNERYRENTEQMNATANQIDESLDKVTELVREIDILSESQVFINIKRRVIEEEEYMIFTKVLNIEGLSFSLDESIRNSLDNVDGLVTANFPVKILSTEVYDIITVDDDEDIDYSVHDMVILDDDTIVMTCKNILKRFCRYFDELGSTSVQGNSWGVCKTSRSNRLAVTIHDRQTIQFVKYTEETMSLTKSFTVGCSCRGICCKDRYLYVACGGGPVDNDAGHIRKYDMKGKLICTIDTDNTGRRIFTSPRLMTFDSSSNNIYIADKDNGMIVLDRNGKITSHMYDPFLNHAFGISLASRNAIFVSGYTSNNIQQYDQNNRFVGTILNFTDKIWYPLCIHVDVSKKQLLVSLEKHNTVHVYELEC